MKKYFSIISLFIFISCNQNNNNESSNPEIKDITELVYASVNIKPQNFYLAQSYRSGIIKEVFVEEGDLVSKGQILFQLYTPSDIKNKVNNSEINLKDAKEKYLGEHNLLKNINLEINSLKKQLQSDSINLDRQKTLYEEKVGTKNDLEKLELIYKVNQNKYELLQQQKEQTLNDLEHLYEKALSQVQSDQELLEDFALRSERDGIIYGINKKEGEFIGAQDYFAEIGSTNQFTIELDIDEEDITKINLNDSVFITLNSYKNEVFVALVSKVLPKKNEKTQTFKVECNFVKQPSKLYYGLSGEANIIVDKRENVLVIPSEYLIDDNKVLTNEGEINVTTGVKNMNYVEITSGIDASTTLLKPEE